MLRYTKSTRIGITMGRLLKCIGVLASMEAVNYTHHGEHVDDSESEAFRIQSLTKDFAREFEHRYSKALASAAYPDPRVNPVRIQANLRTVSATFIYELLELTAFARFWHRHHAEAGRPFVILSHNAILANAINQGWAGSDVRFKCPWNWQHSLVLRVGLAFWQFAGEIQRPRRPAATGPYKVATTTHFYGLDRTVCINDVHWWWNSGIPADRVILCFDQPYHSAKREIVKQATDIGFNCVVFKPSAIGDCPELLWKRAPGPAVACVRLWRKLKAIQQGVAKNVLHRWISCRVIDMLYTSERIEDFMREFNVRAFFHYQDADMDYVSLACDAIGGARIGDQWSNIHWPAAYHIRLHQVYFAWGPHYAGIIDKVGSCVDQVLLSGCIIAGTKPGTPASTQTVQTAERLRQKGAKHLLALFDTSLPCAKFYKFFLERVLEDSRWGLLIKSKQPDAVPWVCRYDPDLLALFQKATATGRVHMLEGRLSPADAAAAADFSVGVDINSATVVAALAGYRAIHMDYVRLQESALSDWAIFYHAGRNRLVFNNPQELWDALNRYFDQPGSDSLLGAVDPSLLNHIDPFRDGKASQRIGEYVKDFLELLAQGKERDEALQTATNHYADKWGEDKIWNGLAAAPAPVLKESHG